MKDIIRKAIAITGSFRLDERGPNDWRVCRDGVTGNASDYDANRTGVTLWDMDGDDARLVGYASFEEFAERCARAMQIEPDTGKQLAFSL